MAVEDDMTKWRTIFCKDPSHTLVTTYPNPGTAHTVVQSDPTKLLCTTTPSALTAQKVVQADYRLLNVTNTPSGEGIQPVSQGAAIRGIWPAPGSVRVYGNGVQSGNGITIIYTVPANKSLYIYSVQTTIQSNADGDFNGRMAVRNAADAFQFYIHYYYMRIEGQQSLSESYSPAMELETGWDVYMQTTHAAIAVRGCIKGWLEDV